jgi:antirestriction protein ArdC
MNKETMQRITENVVAKIEKDGLKWLKTWKGGFKLPKNLESKKDYRGFNILSCLFTMDRLGTSNPYFLTFNQINKLKASIKQGEKGTPIVYYRMLERKEENEETGEDETRRWPMLRYYYVWNITQTTISIKEEEKPERIVNINETCEEFINRYADKPEILKGHYNPCYSPEKDQVMMPFDKDFINDSMRYQTLFHELVHSTGHEKRLNRNIKNNFGATDYGKEEIVAELTTIFICNLASIERETQENSEAYIAGWVKKIRENPQVLLKTMTESQKIIDYMNINKEEKIEVLKEDSAEIEKVEVVKDGGEMNERLFLYTKS